MEKRILQIIPAPEHTSVIYRVSPDGVPTSSPVSCFVLVQDFDGRFFLEPVIGGGTELYLVSDSPEADKALYVEFQER